MFCQSQASLDFRQLQSLHQIQNTCRTMYKDQKWSIFRPSSEVEDLLRPLCIREIMLFVGWCHIAALPEKKATDVRTKELRSDSQPCLLIYGSTLSVLAGRSSGSHSCRIPPRFITKVVRAGSLNLILDWTAAIRCTAFCSSQCFEIRTFV